MCWSCVGDKLTLSWRCVSDALAIFWSSVGMFYLALVRFCALCFYDAVA